MKESHFLNVYQYVEVVADCDLEKMRELEKEFVALGDILGKQKYDASIRFRRLGRHHAWLLFLYLMFDSSCKHGTLKEISR